MSSSLAIAHIPDSDSSSHSSSPAIAHTPDFDSSTHSSNTPDYVPTFESNQNCMQLTNLARICER